MYLFRNLQSYTSFMLGLILLFPTMLLQAAESNTDRPGSDYRSFRLGQSAFWDCEAVCDSEPQCKSWTYVKPGVQGKQAMCWLKNGVPSPTFNTGCISGVKFTKPIDRTAQKCWCKGGGSSIGIYRSEERCKTEQVIWPGDMAFFNPNTGMCTNCQAKNVRCSSSTSGSTGSKGGARQKACLTPPDTYGAVRGTQYSTSSFYGAGPMRCFTINQAAAERTKGVTVNNLGKSCWTCPTGTGYLTKSGASYFCEKCPNGKRAHNGCCK